jgi:hypothetical protein
VTHGFRENIGQVELSTSALIRRSNSRDENRGISREIAHLTKEQLAPRAALPDRDRPQLPKT